MAPWAFFVVNPAAGEGKTSRIWSTTKDRFVRLGLRFEFAETTRRGEATELARRAVLDGWPLVVAVGGDGTVNEVLNGLAGAEPAATLGIVNTGRGKDCCRNLGLPSRPSFQAARLLEGEDIPVDLGVVRWPDGRQRYFVNALGAGFDAAVAERAQRARGSGTIPYLFAVLGTLRAHRAVPSTILVNQGFHSSGPITAAVIANGPYYGGGMKIAPSADPRDGLLDLVLLGDLSRGELLRWLPTVYRGGHLANPKVTTARGRTVSIEAPTPLLVHVDGELCGETPVQVSIRPGALRLRV